MTGFEVRFKDKVIYASVGDKGVLPVIVSYVRNSSDLCIGGLASEKHIKWYSGCVDDVDKITVRVVDVQQNSELTETYSDDSDYGLVKEYYAIQKEIEAIQKEIEKENCYEGI
jgi:hypothetical protein